MSNISNEEAEDILSSPLTYFKDKDGYIYWSKGINTPDGKLVANLVYIPVTNDKADRFISSTGHTYIKRIMDNCIDVPTIDDLPQEIQLKINDRMWRCPITNAGFIAVSTNDISDVYSPRKAFIDAMSSDCPHSMIVYSLQMMLEECGISQACCGVYGALQVKMQNMSNGPLKDIDIVVYGIDNYNFFKNINEKLLDKYGFERYHSDRSLPYDYSDIVLRIIRRRDLALCLVHKTGLMIEIRFVRSPKDVKTFPVDFFINHGINTTFYGIIENDKEVVATSPSTYVVRTDDNRIKKVTSLNYRMVGAAFTNERVSVNGLETSDNFVVLTKPNHYIVSM